ncbi:hypothetical protein RCG67_16350 [Kocuria sp. CPCC 205292]|uniref:hypothetical protein n=1 Tax=Kocuria cellulosilytica TaxID=3071451 RepID=UPI0034D5BEB0
MVVSRRSFVLSGLVLAVSGALGGTLPEPSGGRRPFVLWGSSSAASALHRDRPRGFPAVRIEDLLSQLLEAPGASRAVSGDRSWQTLAMRSRAHPYLPRLGSGYGVGRIPAHGELVVPTVDGRVPGVLVPVPGTVSGVPCTIRAVARDGDTVVLRREVPGAEVDVAPASAARWRTALEERHRGHVHLLWTGKNNIEDPDQVVADTRAAWQVEPGTSVVMGQWHTVADRRGTAGWEQVRGVNAVHRREYGDRFYDTMADLRDPGLWSLPGLRPHRIGASAADRRWLALGLPPRSVVAGDRRHLNALGNTIVAHGLHRHLTGPAGLY